MITSPRHPGRVAVSAICLLLGVFGCEPNEPVLVGIPDEPILSSPTEGTATPPPRLGVSPYHKASNVYVDVRHLGGQPFQANRGLLTSQLGSLTSDTALPGNNGQELVYERATIRVTEDRVYMIRVPLPTPLRRTDALELLGFPPQVDKYLVLHREYRLNHQWDFRRIRMMRQSRNSELVTEVEAWRWVPGEHTNRR